MSKPYIPYKIGLKTEEHIKRIHELLESNPSMTLQELGDELNVTRERVRQIIDMNNYFFEHPNLTFRSLGDIKEIKRLSRPKKVKYCSDCGKEINLYNRGGRCTPCRVMSNRITITCSNCGNRKTLSSQASTMRRTHIKRNIVKNPDLAFCSRKCSSTFVGRHWGTGNIKRTTVQ